MAGPPAAAFLSIGLLLDDEDGDLAGEHVPQHVRTPSSGTRSTPTDSPLVSAAEPSRLSSPPRRPTYDEQVELLAHGAHDGGGAHGVLHRLST